LCFLRRLRSQGRKEETGGKRGRKREKEGGNKGERRTGRRSRR
jgi:hypothetical protein